MEKEKELDIEKNLSESSDEENADFSSIKYLWSKDL